MTPDVSIETHVPETGDHGGDAAHVARALGMDPSTMIDLSASMNPFAPDVAAVLLESLTRDRGSLQRYPDPSHATNVLAAAIDVDPDRLVLTNGGAEAIALVAAEVRIGQIVEPEFSLYRRHLEAVEPGAPRWRSNPSNPVGQLADPAATAGVWDEAFYPLATGTWTRGDDRSWRLGSLTKLWSCPGLRLGYVIAPTIDAAAAIRHRQPQWSVNGLALAALPELLSSSDLEAWAADIPQLRERFVDAIEGLGLSVRSTSVNWVLIDRPDLRAELAPHGLLVRDCASFGMPGIHRVALPEPAQFDRVVEAFASVHPRT